MTNKKGFTLSEVMVAIGVLGVLAALLIPAIMSNSPDTSKVMFKKAYFNLERTAEELINDDINYPANHTNSANGIERGFNYAEATTNGAKNKFCYLLSDKLNTISESCQSSAASGTGTFTTTDGIVWTIYVPYSDATAIADADVVTANTQFPVSNTTAYYTTTITVDVNGAKKPNCSVVAFSNPTTTACTANTSPDTFKIDVRYDGKLKLDVLDTAAVLILQNPTDNKKS